MRRILLPLALAGFAAFGATEARAQIPVAGTETVVVPSETIVTGGTGYVVKERRKLFRPRTQVYKVRPTRRAYYPPAASTTTTIVQPAPPATVITTEPVETTSYAVPSTSTTLVAPARYRVSPR